jgi:hypothetical protein
MLLFLFIVVYKMSYLNIRKFERNEAKSGIRRRLQNLLDE